MEKTLEVFDQDAGKQKQKLLFADDATVTECDVNSIKVRLSQMQLCRPRSFGDCWLGCYRQLMAECSKCDDTTNRSLNIE